MGKTGISASGSSAPFGRAALRQLVGHQLVERVDGLRAGADVDKARVGLQPLTLADGVQENLPVPVGVDQAADVAVRVL
jgi:hypothetical protein